MSRPFRLSRAARTDLLQIWNYLAEQVSFDTADRVIEELYAEMTKLGRSPMLGHDRPDLSNDPLKFYLVHRYLVIFAPEKKPIVIARIIHSARDIKAILSSE